MRIDLVIARYQENIEWADQMDSYNVVLYNKSGESVGERGIAGQYQEIFLPNVGREAHTYLYHLIHKYEDLAEITVFMQGHPFPHAPNIFQDLHTLRNGPYDEDQPFIGYIPLGYMHLISDRDGGSPVAGQPYHIGGLEVGRLVDLIWADYPEKLAEFRMEPHICEEMKEMQHFEFSAGACFLVGRDTVRAKPKSWYEHVLSCCESVGEGYPWVMERLWDYVFR